MPDADNLQQGKNSVESLIAAANQKTSLIVAANQKTSLIASANQKILIAQFIGMITVVSVTKLIVIKQFLLRNHETRCWRNRNRLNSCEEKRLCLF